MKYLIGFAFCICACVAGCATSGGTVSLHENDFTNHNSLATDSYSLTSVSDTTRPGPTWSEERESVGKQVRLVTVIIIVAALLVLAVTLGMR